MKPLRISLRILFYKEEKHWIAHCLEFDLVGHGKTQKNAWEMLLKAIAIQFAASIQHKNPENLFSPADGKFFAMFAAGKDIALGTMEFEPLHNGITMGEEIQTREYSDSDSNGELVFA